MCSHGWDSGWVYAYGTVVGGGGTKLSNNNFQNLFLVLKS